MSKISSYSGTVIEYSTNYLTTDSIFSIGEGTATLGAVLGKLLNGQKVKIEEINNKIMLLPSSIALSEKLPEKYILYGFTMEEGSLEPLAYASIKDLESGQMCQSNMFGYYSILLQPGKHYLEVNHSKMPPRIIAIFITSSTKNNLVISPVKLPEVNIDAGNALQQDGGSRTDKYLTGAYNNFLGESDPVRSLYLLPGNVETQETTGKLVVRGGDPDQSLFLLDGNQVFNPSHLLGEISIINNASVKSIRQYKNDFPSRFDGAISSVTEVNTRDGNMDKWTGEASAGLLTGALTLEGPLRKGRTALMLSMRNSWSNPLLNILDDDYRLRFYDIHFKLTHIIDANNKLMLTGYLGRDHLNLRQHDYQNLQVWGNRLATINWNHLLGKRSFVNTTLNVSNYNNLAGIKFSVLNDSTGKEEDSKAFSNYASIERLEAKTQFEYNAFSQARLRFGAKVAQTTIKPFNTSIATEFQEETDYYQPMKPLRFNEYALYIENEFRIGTNILIRPGLNYAMYNFRNYHHRSLQPRLFAAYRINKAQQLTFSYARMVQYLHQVTSPFLGINSEFWVPSTALLRPVESHMINAGYNFNDKKGLFLSVDAYYKTMRNNTNFAEKGNIFYDEDTWEKDILAGKGCSYGAELLARKQVNKWQFQLSYALTRSQRQFAGINEGKKYPFRYDRRHNLNAAVNYSPLPNWDLGIVWYFSSGDLLFLPPGIEEDFDTPTPPNPGNKDPDNTNSFIFDRSGYQFKRIPPYHRLNFNTNFSFHSGKKLTHKVSAGLYNAYQARNKYILDVWNLQNDTYNTTLSENRLFDLTFYLSYTLRF
ncbi:TonB-dependent receptor plug domain-containing protein [Chitinophaga sp. RAB17]|uniref:TonB-dependent receptor plug domain-containing protein n=1 Tax=Chitinophaga sp. RAB17 TaxID=3233049 RepID=UPI003F90BC3F